MLTLLELHKSCPEIFGQLEIYVDGGFTRVRWTQAFADETNADWSHLILRALIS